MSEPADMLLSEFVDAWNAGRRPRVRDYLERASPADRDELAEMLDQWLAIAPTPVYSDEARAAIRAEPALQRALAAIDAEPLLPDVLPRLRERAGLRLRDLAARITEAFGLTGQEERAAEYLERVERGELETAGLSRRLLEALGSVLGADLVGVVGPRPAPAAGGQALFRAEQEAGADFEEELEILSRAALTPAPEPMDELDRLFLGGPEG